MCQGHLQWRYSIEISLLRLLYCSFFPTTKVTLPTGALRKGQVTRVNQSKLRISVAEKQYTRRSEFPVFY